MKNQHKVMLALLLLFVCRPDIAFSESTAAVPWALLPRVTALDDARKNELMDVLSIEPNYGNCKKTMLQCLVAEKPDKTAVRFANFGGYLVSRGVPAQSLGFLARERDKFLNQTAVQAFSTAGSPSLGSPMARMVIAEFAEFKCTYCVALGPILKKLVADSNGKVRLVFKHFPLKNHSGSLFSSKAAQAAHKQGKFWEMYDLLFRDFRKQGMEDVLEYAQTSRMDLERFKRDLEDRAIEELIERDKMEGVRAKVQGTPTLFINGKMYHLRHDEDFLKDMLNEVAENLGLAPPYQEWVYMRQPR